MTFTSLQRVRSLASKFLQYCLCPQLPTPHGSEMSNVNRTPSSKLLVTLKCLGGNEFPIYNLLFSFISLRWVLVVVCGISFPHQGWNPGPLCWELGVSPQTTTELLYFLLMNATCEVGGDFNQRLKKAPSVLLLFSAPF